MAFAVRHTFRRSLIAYGAVALIVTPSIRAATPVPGLETADDDGGQCGAPSLFRRVSRPANADITSVGITYFAGRSRDGDDAHLAAALTRELATQLLSARMRSGSASSRSAPNRLLTVKLSQGGFADVDLSMTGAVFREGPQLRTTVKVTRTVDGSVLWAGTKVRPIQDLPILARLIAQEVAVRIGAQLTAPAPRAAGQKSADVYELLLRGIYARSRYEPTALAEGIEYLDQALVLDPSSTLARAEREQAELRLLTWGGLGDSLESALRARGLLRHVLERNMDESERLVDEADGEIRDGQPAHACQLLNAAIRADERSAPAYALRAIVRARGGNVREAFSDAETVSQLGRLRWGNALRALVSNRSGDTTSARLRARRIVADARQIKGPLAFWDARLMAAALTETGYGPEAQTLLRRIDPHDPRIAWLGKDPLLVRPVRATTRRRRGE